MYKATLYCNGGSQEGHFNSPDYRQIRKQCCDWLRAHTEKGSSGIAFLQRERESKTEIIDFTPSDYRPHSGRFTKIIRFYGNND